MATEKNINSRIQHKLDFEANWLKATNFIPKAGELIIYDVDATHTEPRLKIGNGTTSINDLPFAGDSSKVTDTKVTQNAAITTNGEYPVILGNTTGIEEVTDTVNKTSTLKYNPSTKVLTAPTFRGGLITNSSNIILTESINYSTELPASGVEGQLYFLEDNSAKANARNLLDNSDFTNFIAQAGVRGHHGTQIYAGDRWILDSGTVTGDANLNSNGYSNITLTGSIRQIVAEPPTVGTAFVEMVSGTAAAVYKDGEVIVTSYGGVIKNVALYAGVYTDENKPAYQPKGYTAEYFECR